MTEMVEGGASLAWRLLATLEGGSLVLATTALLAYTARHRHRRGRRRRRVRTVVVTNTENTLGRKLKQKLEAHGCVVTTVTSGAGSGAGSGAVAEAGGVDALVVIGAEPKSDGLDGLGLLVSEDVYENLRLLDSLSPLVRYDGYIAWACANTTSGPFSGAAAAFDDALQASLQHAAKASHCEPVWIGRCDEAERAAELVVDALLTCTNTQQNTRSSVRNAVAKISGYLGRWLKIVT